MKRKAFRISPLIIVSLFALSSCNRTDFEGKMKDFVNNFNFDSAFENTKSCTATYIQNDIQNDSIVDYARQYYVFANDSISPYYYYKGEFSGQYAIDVGVYYQEELAYFKNGNYFYQQKVNSEEVQTIEIDKDGLSDKIISYFYTNLESGYHRYGKYYGDNIMINGGSYAFLFTLDEENETLTYNLVNDISYSGYIINNKFTVDKYGMLLKSDMSTVPTTDENPISIISEFEATYNESINRIDSLN